MPGATGSPCSSARRPSEIVSLSVVARMMKTVKRILAILGLLFGLCLVAGGIEGFYERENPDLALFFAVSGVVLAGYCVLQMRRLFTFSWNVSRRATISILVRGVICLILMVGLLYVGSDLYVGGKSRERMLQLNSFLGQISGENSPPDPYAAARMRTALARAARMQKQGLILLCLVPLPLVFLALMVWEALQRGNSDGANSAE